MARCVCCELGFRGLIRSSKPRARYPDTRYVHAPEPCRTAPEEDAHHMPPASRQLRDKLDEVLEPVHAEELLSLMPPDWTQLATKTDLAELRAELKTDMAQLRAELKTDMAELRAELKTDMAQLRGEFGDLRGEFGELKATMHHELRKQTTFIVATMVTLVGTMTALMAAFGG